jgi:hypothetical protein
MLALRETNPALQRAILRARSVPKPTRVMHRIERQTRVRGFLHATEYGSWCISAVRYVSPRQSMARAKEIVCREFGLDHDVLISTRQTANVALPRHIAMYLCPKVFSLPQIGRAFGNRDHTTAMHAIRRIKKLRANDANMDVLLSRLEAEMKI